MTLYIIYITNDIILYSVVIGKYMNMVPYTGEWGILNSSIDIIFKEREVCS